jgi:ribosome maturation factor RimP
MGEKAYVLEIGTRGVDAPLTKPAHWRRNIGRLVKVRMGDGEPTLDRIVSADDEGAVMESTGRILYADVRKAVVQVEMRDVLAAPDELDLEDADDESSADDFEDKE